MQSQIMPTDINKQFLPPQSTMKKLTYVEYLEFMCRLASSTFTLDTKAAKKSNLAIRKIVEMSQQPFGY